MEQEKVSKRKIFDAIDFKNLLKGVLIALSFSIVCILIFAMILKFVDMNTNWIVNINQIIKVLSILIACIIMSKKEKVNLVSAMILGICYSIISFFVFSALSGHFTFDYTLLFNIIFAGIIGLICGVIIKGLK